MPAGLDLKDNWQLLLAEWSEQTGAQTRLLEYPARNDGQADGGLPPASADLLVFPVTRMAELASGDRLAPIPENQLAQGNLAWRDVFAGLRENMLSVENRPVAVPVSAPVLVCYYRRDLLEKHGHSPPRTWTDYQRLCESLDEWAPGKTVAEPWGPKFRATMFLARAAPYAMHPGHVSLFFDYSTGKPLIDNPAFVRALDEVRAAVKTMPSEVLDYTPQDCRRAFFAGKAALAITLETGPGNPPLPFASGSGPERADATSQEPTERSAKMRVGFCRLPGVREVYNRSTGEWEPSRDEVHDTTLAGFAGLCAGVSAAGRQKEQTAAWNLLRTLVLDNRQAAFPAPLSSPCRESHLGQPAAWVGEPMTDGEGRFYLESVAESLRARQLATALPVVGRSRFRAALSAGVTEVLTREATPKHALGRVAERWRQISEKIGAARVRDSYRRHLGLRPLATGN